MLSKLIRASFYHSLILLRSSKTIKDTKRPSTCLNNFWATIRTTLSVYSNYLWYIKIGFSRTMRLWCTWRGVLKKIPHMPTPTTLSVTYIWLWKEKKRPFKTSRRRLSWSRAIVILTMVGEMPFLILNGIEKALINTPKQLKLTTNIQLPILEGATASKN